LKADADYVGKAGYAMLLKMDCFINFFGGRFAEVGAKDSYIGLKLLSQGRSVKPWIILPKLKRLRSPYYSWQVHFVKGLEMFKCGYEPLHVLIAIRQNIGNVFAILGYLAAIVKKEKRYDFAQWVFKAQLRRLLCGK
jgi:hypothetical protein